MFYGFNFSNDEEKLKIIEILEKTRSNDRVTVRRIFHADEEEKAYSREIQIYRRGSKFSSTTPYIHIKWRKYYKYTDAFDVKMSGHVSRFKLPPEYTDLLLLFDPSGVIKSAHERSTTTNVHLKRDIYRYDLNYFLSHVVTDYPNDPHVDINPDDGRRTFYLTLNQYFYDRPDWVGIVRFEFRLNDKESIQKVLGTNNTSDILSGNFSVSRDYLERFYLVDPRSRDPTVKVLNWAHQEIIKCLDEIDLKERDATISYQEMKCSLNRLKSIRGKFGKKVERSYPRESFVEKFLK